MPLKLVQCVWAWCSSHYGGGPRWNPRCCSLFVFIFTFFLNFLSWKAFILVHHHLSYSFSSINNPPYSIILSLATTWLDSNRNNSKNNCTHSTLPNRSEKGDHYYLFTECGIVIINCSSFLYFNDTNDEQFYM